MDYSDYKEEQKEVVLDEPFNDNSNGWLTTHSKVEKGLLVVNDMWGKTNKPKSLLDLKINQTKNFEVEIKLLFHNQLVGAYIMWDNYIWCVGGSSGYVSFKNKISMSYDDIKNRINKEQFYKYTIRKIDGNFYFFINEKYIGTTPYNLYENIDKLSIGFIAKSDIDEVKVNYLLNTTEVYSQNKTSLTERTPSKSDGLIITPEIKEGGKYYALIVGVSDYAEPKLNLDKPSKDAEKLKEILVKKYSFADSTTYLLLNPTRQKIITELYRLRKVIGANDNLLIFYAGHGYWDEDARQGYWWARDATPNDPSSWLSNSDLREQIRSIKSAHTLLISDACFSGGIFKTRSGNEIQNATKDIQLLYKMPSRRAMTSGTMTEVPDKSIFLEYLTKRLNDNTEKFISSQQLFDSFRAAVINNSNVVPQDGVIAETGDEGGDFIFILKDN